MCIICLQIEKQCRCICLWLGPSQAPRRTKSSWASWTNCGTNSTPRLNSNLASSAARRTKNLCHLFECHTIVFCDNLLLYLYSRLNIVLNISCFANSPFYAVATPQVLLKRCALRFALRAPDFGGFRCDFFFII
jgi:hypothetical protein